MKKGGFRILLACIAFLVSNAGVAQTREWVRQSNEHAQVLLEVLARYEPEAAASLGVEGHDENIFDLKPRAAERQAADLEAAARKLTEIQSTVNDPRVRQDLDILIQAASNQRNTLRLQQRLLLEYDDLPKAIYGGFQDLLDDRVSPERQAAALVRLRRYIGEERGYQPVTALARARFAERAANTSLVGPWIVEVQESLDNQPRYIEGIQKLLKASGLKGWQRDMHTLTTQLNDYAAWVRSDFLPRARQSHRPPEEIYAEALKNFGVNAEPQELIDRSLAAYAQARNELASLARMLAAQRGWKSADYRDVIRELKKEHIARDELLDLYRSRARQIEETVRREGIVSIPGRSLSIRLATEAESADNPVPHIDPPRLIGNTGEPAQFVLAWGMEDFNYHGISWILTVHEARPGHDLQFASMLEQGVSTARVVFAFNSANVEGWALYVESVMKEYMPLEGQVGALQMRMLRAARAFLDPMLNLGLLDPGDAQRMLVNDVMLSEAMAKAEIDRYTFNNPGQATAYFYGYARLMALRGRVQLALGDRFNERAFHDFILSQGLLPLEMLERAVMENFVPASINAQRE